MGYNWKLSEINVGNVGSASASADLGETRLDPPPSKKGYVAASAAFMKYEIRVPVGDTSKYEEMVVVLEPMTSFSDYDGLRKSRLFADDRVKGRKVVKKFYDAANLLYTKFKKKFPSAERVKLEKSLGIAKSYLNKVSGAVDYWAGHSLHWPIDQTFKDFGYGACLSFSDAGDAVKAIHPEYGVEVDVLCPTSEEHSAHDNDRAQAELLLNSAAAHVRYVERHVWPKEVAFMNSAASAVSRGPTKKVSNTGSGQPVKLVTINAESIGEVGSGSAGKTSKKKKKSALPLVAVAGIGALLLMRK